MKEVDKLKGTLLDAKPDLFFVLNADSMGWTLTIETMYLKRKVKVYRKIDVGVNVREMIGKKVSM